MQNIQSEKMVSAEYLKTLFDRFERNNERLFFVDGSKPRAFSALKSLLKTYGCDTQLCIAQDEMVADEVAGGLGVRCVKICSTDDFMALLQGIGVDKKAISYDALVGVASRFREAYPNVVIASRSSKTGESILHARLCDNTNVLEAVLVGDNSVAPAYCISDFLCESAYEFVIIDNIYEIISLEQSTSDEKREPDKYERLDFLGDAYYASLDRSFKKLRRLVDNATKSVIMSDLIVDKSAATMYVALNILHDSFSFKEAKKFIMPRTRDYIADCEYTYVTFVGASVDDMFLNQCVLKNRDILQRAPKDISEMQVYLSDQMSFMSKDEIFLKAIYSLAKTKFGLELSSIDIAYESLIESENASSCVCEMFFRDVLKGEFEDKLSTAHVCEMKREEIDVLVSIFNKYGVCFDLPDVSNKCSIIRIYREGSSFEDAIRAIDEDFDKPGQAYCVSADGDMLAYKCVAVKNMLSSGELSAPMIIVVNDNTERVAELITSVANGYKCVSGLSELYGLESIEKTITVIDYGELRRTASFPDAHSVVYFDILADISIFNVLLKKSLATPNARAKLLVDYTDLGGHMVDKWGGVLLSGKLDPLPIRSNEVFLKGRIASDYAQVIPEINEAYVALRRICEGKDDEDITALAEAFRELVSRHTLTVFKRVEVMRSEFEYLLKIAEYYNAIFENSMTLGAHGERVTSSRILATFDPKKKQMQRSVDERNEPDAIMFNVCSRQLHRSCDVLKHDCASCPNYQDFKINDFDEFSKGVRGFFVETERIAGELEMERLKRIELIHGEDEDAQMFSAVKASENAQSALERLEALNASREGKTGVFYASNAIVSIIKKSSSEIYIDILSKYYDQINTIFETATEKMITAFTTISKTGGVSHLNNAE